MQKDEVVQAMVDLGWSKVQARLGVRAGFRCEYCGRNLLASIEDYDSWQKDHVVPISKGGAEEDFENLALACKTCNFMKLDHMPNGETREQKIDNARRRVMTLRARKHREIAEVLEIVSQLEE